MKLLTEFNSPMSQLDQDILYLEDIQGRTFQMSQQLAGTYDVTELDVEKRAQIYRIGDQVAGLKFSLKNLQKILIKEERLR